MPELLDEALSAATAGNGSKVGEDVESVDGESSLHQDLRTKQYLLHCVLIYYRQRTIQNPKTSHLAVRAEKNHLETKCK